MPRTKAVKVTPSKHVAPVTRKPRSKDEEQVTHASSVKAGRKPRQLTTDERLERLERLHAALVVKLRPHGIHLPPDDEQETQLEIQAQEKPSTE